MRLNDLNPEQRTAVETLEGPVLVLAGAGSGKTRALTYRIANLLEHGIEAYRILALTFTNKAAAEMKSRVEQLVGDRAADEAWISTFHSCCTRILRRDIDKIGYSRSFTIYDEDDQNSVIKSILKQLNIDEKYLPPREIRSKISDAKNRLLSPDEWFRETARDRRCSLAHDVMILYEKKLLSMNALDFDDLLLKTLTLFSEHPPVLRYYRDRFRYVLVDEYQDTNRAQYEMIRLITAESRNLCVVGDDDQSIYGWRGADIRNILDFEDDYPDATVIKLEQNYRSTSNILDAANQIIAHNEGRKDKKLWTESEKGDMIHLYCADNERDEADWITGRILALHANGLSYGDMAVLYRANAQSRIIEDRLMGSVVPYKVFGGQKFYDRKEIRDILAYLRVICNPADDVSLRRIINVPKRSIGETTVQELVRYAEEKGIPLFSAMSDLPPSLGSRAKQNISEFAVMMTMLTVYKETMGLCDFLDCLIDQTGLQAQYENENTDEARARIDNINEMKGAVREFAESDEKGTLEAYLENVALVTDLDREKQSRSFVTLMTLHSAKGLEFNTVFIPGLEEGVFPSSRSMTEENRLEEERRLMYVGITRARKRLYLSRSIERMLYNQYNRNPPSCFLAEIPNRLIKEEKGTGYSPYHTRSASRQRAWNAGNDLPEYSARPRTMRQSPPTPRITFKGVPLEQIPGVSKGFVSSKARESTAKALSTMYHTGDSVYHPKFGQGTVLQTDGTRQDGRIRILFEQNGEKELSLAVAPLVKLEE